MCCENNLERQEEEMQPEQQSEKSNLSPKQELGGRKLLKIDTPQFFWNIKAGEEVL